MTATMSRGLLDLCHDCLNRMQAAEEGRQRKAHASAVCGIMMN